MEKIFGIGAGGHARSLVDALQCRGSVAIIGLLTDDSRQVGAEILGVQVLGGNELLPWMRDQGVLRAFVGVGSVGLPDARERLFRLLQENEFRLDPIVHPSAVVAKSAVLGSGTVVLGNAVVGPGTILGANVIVNSGAIVEHDCEISAHCHIAPGACIAGGVKIEARSHVGLGACVIQNLTIGSEAIIGAGAVVVEDVGSSVVVVGSPARVLRPSRIAHSGNGSDPTVRGDSK